MHASKRAERSSSGAVVVGTSAGGLAALQVLLRGLPADFPLPILIVQHLARHHPSSLARILTRSSALPVQEARDGEIVQPGHVYIAVPDHHLTIEKGGRVRLTGGAPVHFSRPSADVLFTSAAAAYGASAIALLLTGSGRDGADGAMRIKEAGGTVICSDEETSEYFSMAKGAIALGAVDAVVPLPSIARKLSDIVESRSST